MNIAVGPSPASDWFDHHHVRERLVLGQAEGAVAVDLHPRTAVSHMDPAVSDIETIVVGEQNDEIHSAASGGLLEHSQKTSGESARTLSLVHTNVDNPEGAHDLITYSEGSELDTHLC